MPAACQSRGVTEPQREKTRLEYNQTPPQKLDFSSFWEKAFCPLTKCSAAEAQSKKSITGFFDKLPRGGYHSRPLFILFRIPQMPHFSK